MSERTERRIVGDYIATPLKGDPTVWVYELRGSRGVDEHQPAAVVKLPGALGTMAVTHYDEAARLPQQMPFTD